MMMDLSIFDSACGRDSILGLQAPKMEKMNENLVDERIILLY